MTLDKHKYIYIFIKNRTTGVNGTVLKIKERRVNKLKKGFNATLLPQFDKMEGCLNMNNNRQWGGL